MAQQSYKKFVASAATATLVASALIPVASANVTTSAFTDVPASYKDAVDFVVSNNISAGLTATSYGVNSQIKRVDAAVMIAAAAGMNDKDAPASGFKDVPARAAVAVNSLKAAGVVNGKSTTNFGSQDNITRGEAAIMLQKAFDLKAGDTKNSFTDVKDSYDAAVDALVANKVTSGINATQFGTGNPIKRGDFAKFLFALKDQIVVANAVETVTVVNETTTTAKLKVANKELTAADFKVLVDGEAVTPEKVESDAKGEVYTITHASLKGKKGIVSVNGKQAEFDFVSGVQVESVKATNAKTLTVTFTQPVTATAADFTVNKGTVKANVASVALSEDKKTATIEMTSKLTEGEYTVTVAQKDADALKGSVKVENEKVASIKVLSDVAPFTNSTKTAATVGVQVLNQYGENVTKLNASDVNVTVSGAATSGTLNSEGTLALTLAPLAKEGDTVNITLVHAKTGVVTQAQVKLSAVPAISDIKFGDLYNKDGKTLSQDTDFSKDKFYIPVTTKDQYGNNVTKVADINTEVLFTNSNPGVVTLDGAVKSVTINGKEVNALEVTGTNLAGTSNLIAVSKTTGKSATTAITVADGVKVASVSVSAPTAVLSAGKDAYFPLSVIDTAGKEIKTLKELNAIKEDKLIESSNYVIGEVEGKDGLFVTVPANKVVKDQAVTVVITSKSGKVATQTMVAKAAAKATVITGLNPKKATALRANQAGVTLNNTDLIVEDQYGQVITDKTDLGNILFTGSVEAGSASAAALDVATAVNQKSVTVKPKTNTSETAGTVTFKLASGTTNEVEASAFVKKFTIVKDSQFESFVVEDVPTIYAEESNGVSKVKAGYDQDLEVKAKTASGEVVTLVEGTDFSVTGKPAVADTIAFADKATTAKKTVTITINGTGEVLTKELTYSNVAPKVSEVKVVKNQTVTDASNDAKADISNVKLEEVSLVEFTGGAAFDLTTLASKVDFVITDTYGVSVAVDENPNVVATLKDGSVVAQTLTFSKGSEGVKFVENGTKDAKVSEYVVDSSFVSTVKFGGVSANAVKATAKTNPYSATAIADATAVANAKTAVQTTYADVTQAEVEAAGNADAQKAFLLGKVNDKIASLDLKGASYEIVDIAYVPAVTSTTPGTYKFKVKLTKGLTSDTSAEQTLTITQTS